MWQANLSAPDWARYVSGLTRSHERKIRVEVLDLEDQRAGELGLRGIAGSVSVTRGGDQDVSRILQLNASDPNRTLDLDPASPGESVYFDRQLRVWDERHIPDLGWVACPIFQGPVYSFRRRGASIDVTCHSKERLAMGALWTPMTIRANTNKISAIKQIMDATGEGLYDLGATTERMQKRVLDRYVSGWEHARKIADTLNRQLLYTNDGFLRLRSLPDSVAYTFLSGENGAVLTEPDVQRDVEGLQNIWHVLGKKPKGKTPRRQAIVKIDNHPLSAARLGRRGQGRNLVELIEDNALSTNAECERLGSQRRADAIRDSVSASFESAVIPFLDPGDLGRLEMAEGSVEFRVWEFTIPLGQGSMSVGAVRRK